MKCPHCHVQVSDLLATFWNGKRWHRSCAVHFQIDQIAKLEEDMRSPGLTPAKANKILEDLTEAEADLFALRKSVAEEKQDLLELGKKMKTKGFGGADDKKKLLADQIKNSRIKELPEPEGDIKQLY